MNRQPLQWHSLASEAQMESRDSFRNEHEAQTATPACTSSGPGDPARHPPTGLAATPPHGERRRFGGFERERITYQRLKGGLLAHADGKFVVIVGEDFVGPLDSHDQAEKAGYARFGLGPLFVKQICIEDPVVEVSRLFTA
jgi:hypothetical protein